MKLFYIKHRVTPQSNYYVAEGQMTKKDAKKKENPIYGDNYMIPFHTKKEYETAIADLKREGKSVQ